MCKYTCDNCKDKVSMRCAASNARGKQCRYNSFDGTGLCALHYEL